MSTIVLKNTNPVQPNYDLLELAMGMGEVGKTLRGIADLRNQRSDRELLAQALPMLQGGDQAGISELLGKIKTPEMAGMLMKQLISTAPQPVISQAEAIKRGSVPANAKIVNTATEGTYMYDPATREMVFVPGKVEQVKQLEQDVVINPRTGRREVLPPGQRAKFEPKESTAGDLLENTTTGELRYFTNEQMMGGIPKGWQKASSGGLQATTTLPDGTVVSVGTGKAAQGATGMQPGTIKKVEEDLLSATGGLSQAVSMQKSFKPEYQTYGGQIKGAWSSIKDKWDSGGLGPQDKEYLQGFANWRTEAGRFFNEELKRLSGGAVTPQEADRQKVNQINPGTGIFDGDSPQVAQTKMNNFIGFQRRAVARLNHVRKSGVSIQNVPLEKMDTIMQERGRELETQFRRQGLKPGEAVKKAMSQVAEEFGLVE